ncbi:hypothetical protein A6V39_00385 [Candidatus Mycoplasma haematobovis]|uniref:Uncharacterized protein n=1 Tax=Candidatus Mycoplasma haematobovis TaxID=432608 RepID=A0A1A9QDF0_9MOLU|nr:hypothetical protein [Candidatus Mycoplasma haematobovis]OAL10507.1 hypothetical protein A6V39_00385 [Candidatus Mycoplasma haematobovis]
MEIKSLAVKSAAGLIGIGGTGVAIQQVYKSLTTTDNKDDTENKEKTIADRLTNQKINLIKSEEGYQLAFKELKKTPEFIAAIKNSENNVTDKSSLSEGGNAVKSWCNKNLIAPLSQDGVDDLIEKVKDYCLDRPATIVEKLKQQGKQLVTQWKERLTSLKTTDDATKLQQELAVINPKVVALDKPTEEEASQALKTWCDNKSTTKIIEDANDEIFGKVEKRCFEAPKPAGDI